MFVLLPAAVTAALLSNPVAVVPAHAASCAAKNQPARIVRSVRPETPEIAKLSGVTGTSIIRVDLSETGSVSHAYVAVSSGNSSLDQAAIRTTELMAYAPETLSCAAMPGSYAVKVEFVE